MRSLTVQTSLLDSLGSLAKNGVALLHVSGEQDPWLSANTRIVQQRYKALGGKMKVIIIAGEGHFPRLPRDPALIVDFIIRNTQ